MSDLIAYPTLFLAGLGVGLSIGVALMASLRLAKEYDAATSDMLDDAGYDVSPTVVHDFTGGPPA